MFSKLLKKEGKFMQVVNHTSQIILCSACLPFFKLNASIRVHGTKNISKAELLKKEGGGIIFAINHVTDLDVIIVPSSLNYLLSPLMPIHYVSMEKKKYSHYTGIRKFLWGGWLFTILGAYPVRKGMHDYELSLKNHIELLTAGKSVGIFPTGKRGENSENNYVHGGVAYLAKRTGARIVPVLIKGFDNFNTKDFLLSKYTLDVIFGEPIYYTNIEDKNINSEEYYKKTSQNIMSRIMSL